MRKFHQVVDDGTSLSASAEDTFPSIERAIHETIRAAAMMAVEDLDEAGHQAFSCEVQDAVSRERRSATVRFSVEYH